MFKDKDSNSGKDDYVIRHEPNRLILFVEQTKWYWPTLFLLVVFSLFIILNPASTNQSNAPTTPEGTLILLLVLFSLLFLPFYIGVRLGGKLYKPQNSHLTKKQLKIFDELLSKKEGNMAIKFIRKDGKIELLGEEQE